MDLTPRFVLGALLSAALTFAAGPVSFYGQLNTVGNRIVGSKTGNSTAVQVRGVSLGWSNTNWESADFFHANAVNKMVDGWKAEVIRAPLGAGGSSGGYNSDPTSNLARIKAVVDAAIAKDVYVIIDWHSHNAEEEVSTAKEFFREIAQTYGKNDHVIFEIYNEPDYVAGKSSGSDYTTWATIKTYAEDVIDVIREHSDNLILVGTPRWCQLINHPATAPITGRGNVAYVFHFYSYTHSVTSKPKQ